MLFKNIFKLATTIITIESDRASHEGGKLCNFPCSNTFCNSKLYKKKDNKINKKVSNKSKNKKKNKLIKKIFMLLFSLSFTTNVYQRYFYFT